ncbi:MAG: FecR domain-containing protein [Ectothiorhodospiraceae bacterium]|nr:FecR domain-containing protein [Chromatiales bacterium]MCP5156726.1 FecR domain-containing protein [Ectothiorhodospiraceae bacterium]
MQRTGRVAVLALALGLLGAAGAAQAQGAAGTVNQARGQVVAATADGQFRALAQGSTVHSGDTINTGPGSYVKVGFSDGSSVYLRPGTRFRVDEFADGGEKEKEKDRSFFSLLKGGLRYVTGLIGRRNRDAFRLSSPVATIGIRGTDFVARLCLGDCLGPDGLYTQTNEGVILVSGGGAEITSPAGQFSYVCPGCVPEPIQAQPAEFQIETYPGGDTQEEPECPG